MRRIAFVFASLVTSTAFTAAAVEDPPPAPVTAAPSSDATGTPAPATTTPADDEEPAAATSTPASESAIVPVIQKGDEPTGRRNSAAQVTRDGTFLPLTLPARVGDHYVAALFLGGYETTPGQGAIGSAVVEGALANRIALRVGVEYNSLANKASPSVGVRVGLLRQERHGVDLGLSATYQNVGFSETKGEMEFAVSVARRWNRFGLYGNVVYGQGFVSDERDGEVRIAALYQLGERWNVGFDARGRFDLGEESEAREANKLENEFDLLAGPMATFSVGPLMLLAQAGAHLRVQHEEPYAGFAAIGGAGLTY